MRIRLCCVIPMAMAATAMAADPPVDSPPVRARSDTLDEVVISARVDSLSALAGAIVAAEDRFYARWNEINQDDAFDVQCRVEAPKGRRNKRRICDARLVDEATHDGAMALFTAGGGNIKIESINDIREAVAAELKRRTLPVLADPVLRAALLERTKLQKIRDALLEKHKKEGRLAVWD